MNNDNEVIPFKPRLVTSEVTPDPNAPDRLVVDLLERALARAKAGDMKFVAIAWVNKLGVGYSTWEPELDTSPNGITQALGAVAYLNHRFGRACDEGADEDPDGLAIDLDKA